MLREQRAAAMSWEQIINRVRVHWVPAAAREWVMSGKLRRRLKLLRVVDRRGKSTVPVREPGHAVVVRV